MPNIPYTGAGLPPFPFPQFEGPAESPAPVRYFQRYPEIALLPRRPEIFAVKEVIATEKLHGSNFRIYFPLGMTSIADVKFGSRETEHGTPGEKFPLGAVVLMFQSKPELLTAMWETLKAYDFPDATVFGEAYGPGIKAKGVRYSEGQEVLFRAFDIMVGENFLTYDLFCEVTDKMGLGRVPEVWRGPPSIEAFDALLEKPSIQAKLNGVADENNLAEGVVIRSNPLLRNVFGEWLIVKHKAKKFSEVAHAPKPVKERTESPADVFAATCDRGSGDERDRPASGSGRRAQERHDGHAGADGRGRGGPAQGA